MTVQRKSQRIERPPGGWSAILTHAILQWQGSPRRVRRRNDPPHRLPQRVQYLAWRAVPRMLRIGLIDALATGERAAVVNAIVAIHDHLMATYGSPRSVVQALYIVDVLRRLGYPAEAIDRLDANTRDAITACGLAGGAGAYTTACGIVEHALGAAS